MRCFEKFSKCFFKLKKNEFFNDFVMEEAIDVFAVKNLHSQHLELHLISNCKTYLMITSFVQFGFYSN